MKLLQLTKMSELNSAGKRRQLGLFQCVCGIEVERSVSEVKSGNIKACKSCGNKNKGKSHIKDDLQTSCNSAYAKIRSQASIRNIEFTLNKEDFRALVTSLCTYCGASGSSYKIRSASVNGIDRLDSSLGYTKENVVACCKKCNIAKHTLSPKEYIEHCKLVATKGNN